MSDLEGTKDQPIKCPSCKNDITIEELKKYLVPVTDYEGQIIMWRICHIRSKYGMYHPDCDAILTIYND